MRRALLAVLCLLSGTANAAPGSADVSYSVWTVSGSTVLLKFLLPAPAAQSLTGTAMPLLTTRKLGDHVLRHVAVRAAGRACPAVDQGYDLGKVDPIAVGPDLYGFEILFRCAAPGEMSLRDDVLFDRSPGHINFARVEKDGQAAAQLFTAAQRTVIVPAGSAVPAAGLGSYARLGATHLLLSFDRLCFLLGSLLLVRRKEEAAYGFAALLSGYAASLAAAAPDWIVPDATLLEALIGFMVALLAALIALRELRQPRVALLACPALLLVLALVTTMTHAHWESLALFGAALFAAGLLTASQWLSARAWLVPVAVVGFLDGFAMPASLAPVHLLHESQLKMTAGFDVGAVLAATVVMGIPLGLFALARKRIALAPQLVVNELAAAGLGGLGTFWLLSRLFTAL